MIEGEKYTILATLVDQGKQEIAKEKAADAINALSGDECHGGAI